MALKTKILIVEDDKNLANYFCKVLENASYIVDLAYDGKEALNLLIKNKYDALLTDWMMPKLDGINLIRITRERIKPVPLIIMITTFSSERSKNLALDSGADDFLMKPIESKVLIKLLDNTFSRSEQQVTEIKKISKSKQKISSKYPPFIAVVIVTSTGGPQTLTDMLKSYKPFGNASLFIVQHGPDWMLRSFAKRLNQITPHEVIVVEDGIQALPGKVYISPGDTHIMIDSNSFIINFFDGPPENYVKPSADPLFRSAANAFGEFCIAVVLTGLGIDGAKGASEINSANGKIIVQDPETAIAKPMPNSIIEANIPHIKSKIENIPNLLNNTIINLNDILLNRRDSLE